MTPKEIQQVQNVLGFILSTMLVENSSKSLPAPIISIKEHRQDLTAYVENIFSTGIDELYEIFDELEIDEPEFTKVTINIQKYLRPTSISELTKFVSTVVNDHIQDGY